MPLYSTVVLYAIHAHTLIFMNNVAVINPRSRLHSNTLRDPSVVKTELEVVWVQIVH